MFHLTQTSSQGVIVLTIDMGLAFPSAEYLTDKVIEHGLTGIERNISLTRS